MSRATGATAVLLTRAVWGATLLAVPERVLDVTQPHRPDTPVAARVLRVLGARQLLQAGVEALVSRPVAHRLGATADGLHALSGVGLAVVDRRWRRAALIDSGVASAFAAATVSTAGGDR